jgi:hypothetical protein
MPLSLSKTDIVNGALSLIGQEPITDLDTDESEEGDQGRIHYERSRNALLVRTNWRFATRTVALEADLVKTNPLFAASFPVPADCLKFVSSDLDESGEVYILEGDRIVTDASGIIITYIREIEEVGFYSAGFIRVFEYLLASRMAYALTKDKVLSREMLDAYELMFSEEANIDGQQSRHETYIFDSLVNVRYAGSSSGTSWNGGF